MAHGQRYSKVGSTTRRTRVAHRRLIAGAGLLLVAVAAVLLVADLWHSAVPRADADTGRLPSGGGRLHERPGWRPGEPSPNVWVRLAGGRPGRRLPRSYLGLSTEYWSLPRYEEDPVVLRRLIETVRVPGDGRFVIRVGGDSADRTFWRGSPRLLSGHTFTLTPAWFAQAASTIRRDRVGMILDLNLMAGSPAMAARTARTALTRLPRHSLLGLEIGNEPDRYRHELFYRLIGMARSGRHKRSLGSVYSAASYAHSFAVYARALERVAPRVPLIGPAVANPARDLRWLGRLLAADRRRVGVASAHRYPLSSCVPRARNIYGTLARVLSRSAALGMARSVRSSVLMAHRAGVPFRLTELNSVTCGGVPGVSDAFATALWAPDALFALWRTGVDGVNVHVRAGNVNAAFELDQRGLDARPLLYGLITFARALGPGARLLTPSVRGAAQRRLSVWAVHLRGGADRVLLIDKGRRAATVLLTRQAAGVAGVQRLLAPSAASQTGVTLGGRWLTRAGRWTGAVASERIVPRDGRYELIVAPASAALLTIPR